MSLKLSKNRVNFLTKLIIEYIETSDDVDYSDDIGNIRFKIYHFILDELTIHYDEIRWWRNILICRRYIPFYCYCLFIYCYDWITIA